MSTEFAAEDNVLQQLTRDDIATNLEFLQVAGLLEAPLTLPEAVTGGNDDPADSNSDAIFSLTEAVKALA